MEHFAQINTTAGLKIINLKDIALIEPVNPADMQTQPATIFLSVTGLGPYTTVDSYSKTVVLLQRVII